MELTKQYALESTYSHIAHFVNKHKNDWKAVKDTFLKIFPEERSLPSLMAELSSVTRQSDETFTKLYIRMQTIIDQLETLKSASKEVYDDMFVSIFLNVLPRDFTYTLQEADLKKPLTVYK